MRVKVLLAPSGAGQSLQETVEIHCGSGQQIVRWLAYTACTRLAQKRGEVMGCYVPQAVVKDSTVLDVDLVLSEVADDGDCLLVEYSTGPNAFTTRWDQRPKSPALVWGNCDMLNAAETEPSMWLKRWDLSNEGLDALLVAQEGPQKSQQQQQQPQHQHQHQQQPEHAADGAQGAAAVQDGSSPDTQQQSQQAAGQHGEHPHDPPAAREADLEQVRGVMLQYAGALQMLFLVYASEPSSPVDTITRVGLPQFKAMLQAARVTGSSVPPERIEELYMALQAAPGTLARKGHSQCSTTGMDFADFLVLLVQVAHLRYAGESFLTGASSAPLSTKLLSLLQDCICTHLLPELQRRLEKLKSAISPAAVMLLKKGRRLTEQVLERCQIRRVRTAGPLSVPYAYVLRHLERWGLLGKEFSLQELAPVVVFAKQDTTDPYRFVLQSQPVALSYDEFEKLLLGIAVLQARVRKRADAVDEMLGELLDGVYKKSGVLVTLNG